MTGRDGFHTVTPYLLVPRVPALIEFLVDALGATEERRTMRPDGTIMHAEVRIGESMVMMGEPTDQFGPMPAALYVYVDNCDAAYASAIRAGGVSVMEPTTMTHAGERYGGVRDPSGNVWWIATHIEDVAMREEARRSAEI